MKIIHNKNRWFTIVIIIVITSLFLLILNNRFSSKTIIVQYSSGAMLPTLNSGPVKIQLLNNEDQKSISRGSIVYYKLSAVDDYGRSAGNYIGRIIALPGEKVSMENYQLFINNEPLQENYTSQKANTPQSFSELSIPENEYLIIGDMRSVVPLPKSLVHRKDILGIVKVN